MVRWKRALTVAVCAALAVNQLILFTALADDQLMGIVIAPFDPPVFSTEQAQRVAELTRWAEDPARAQSAFDPELGWCPAPGPGGAVYHYDERSARTAVPDFPVEPEAGTLRVAAFGCSFTRGDEVEGDQTWGALLNAREGLALANFGMGGYGLDQTYLRARRDAPPLRADEVWIGWMPASAERVVTHYPPLLNHWTNAVAFKPRFTLDGERLELVPSPVTELADFARLMHDQTELLGAIGASDHWIQRAPTAYAPHGTSWMHRFAITRMTLTAHERRGRDPVRAIGFHSNEVHRIHAALVRQLARDVRADGMHLRVLILPAYPDLEQAALGRAYWAELRDGWIADGIEVLDLAPALEAASARSDGACWMPGGHYSPKANRIVAEAIAEAWL